MPRPVTYDSELYIIYVAMVIRRQVPPAASQRRPNGAWPPVRHIIRGHRQPREGCRGTPAFDMPAISIATHSFTAATYSLAPLTTQLSFWPLPTDTLQRRAGEHVVAVNDGEEGPSAGLTIDIELYMTLWGLQPPAASSSSALSLAPSSSRSQAAASASTSHSAMEGAWSSSGVQGSISSSSAFAASSAAAASTTPCD